MNRQRARLFWSVTIIAVFILGYSFAAPVQKQPNPSSDASKILNEVNTIHTAQASTLKMNLGSITYGVDDHVINLVLDLNLSRYEKVGITFMGADHKGVLFGDMISNLKVGHVEDETTFVAENNRLLLWTQVPVRFLGDGNEAWIEIMDKETGEKILNQKLTFTF